MSFILGRPLNTSIKYNDSEIVLSKQMAYYWSNFIKYNDPNYENKHEIWPKYKIKQTNSNDTLRAYFILNNPVGIRQHFKADYCAFWNIYLRSLIPNTSK